MANNERNPIGFIGTGVMGASMAGHLLDAGYPLRVHNRTPSKAEELLARGAVWADSVAELAAASDVVIAILGYPEDVESVFLGERGAVANARPGTYLVDMTTSRPELAYRIAEAAEKRGAQALDAPVSGGDCGAREGTLSIMVGGEPPAFEAMRPIFNCMGGNIVHQGAAGSGQRAKLANQLAVAGTMLGVCEAMAYARKAGLDPRTVLRSIEHGAAGSWTLSNLAPRMLEGDFAPGFYVKHFIKDLRMAKESAELQLPGLDIVLSRYETLAETFGDEDGTQALFRLYDG